ncbi:MAG: formylglycine-generating enzyme family protein [Marinobacterium sp.]|nr:formylglycine-generating enzyme family protein [Marinobacterium sp.]
MKPVVIPTLLAQPSLAVAAISLATVVAAQPPQSTQQHQRAPEAPVMIYVNGQCDAQQQAPTTDDNQWIEPPCIKSFQMAATEVTVQAFSRFVQQTGYRTDAEQAETGGCHVLTAQRWTQDKTINWQQPAPPQYAQPQHPVSCISFNDAQAYIRWLNQHTGRSYRLPTETELTYAAQGATSLPDIWGGPHEQQACRQAITANNGKNMATGTVCDDAQATIPVNRHPANDFGLKGTRGGLWEWTCSGYQPGPQNGTPQCVASEGGKRALLGGGWLSTQAVTGRYWLLPETQATLGAGFRLVHSVE